MAEVLAPIELGPYVGQDWHPSAPGDSKSYGLDFTPMLNLNSNESISTVTWTIGLSSGTDATPSNHQTGNPTIASPIVYQTYTWGSGAVNGNVYYLQAVIGTNLSATMTLWSHVYILTAF